MRWSVRSLALTQVVLVLAACSADAGTSSSPSSSDAPATAVPIDSPLPSSSLEPLPSESATHAEPVAANAPIPADMFARVVTDDLRIRSLPSVSDGSKKLEPLLQEGDIVLVLDGPVQASGYDWYQVQPVNPFEMDTVPHPFGWVAAAGRDGEPWIKRTKVECPPLPTDLSEVVPTIWFEPRVVELMCFGDHKLTFLARLVTPSEWCGLGEWPAVEPEWMGECTTAPNYLVGLDDDEGEVVLHPAWSPDVDLSFAPAVESPPEAWPTVEVSGRFDHAQAINCRSPGQSSDSPVRERAMTVLMCRTKFVVTSIREIEG
jgi:hypothetical protein